MARTGWTLRKTKNPKRQRQPIPSAAASGLMIHNSNLVIQIKPVHVAVYSLRIKYAIHCFHSVSKCLSDSNSLPNNSNLSTKASTNEVTVDIINTLYKDRIAPVIPFSHPTLISCSNFMNKEERYKFLDKLSGLISERGLKNRKIEIHCNT